METSVNKNGQVKLYRVTGKSSEFVAGQGDVYVLAKTIPAALKKWRRGLPEEFKGMELIGVMLVSERVEV